jgi:hypothetical protein
MSRLRLFQCNEEEAQRLRAAGHEITGERIADAFIINLNRLPSHGREQATAMRGSKSTRHIPIVFVEGAPEKVTPIRELLPDAVYTTWPRLASTLKRLKPVMDPVIPRQMMDRYINRTTAQKLGIKENSTVTVVNAPRDYLKVLGEMPPNVEITEEEAALSAVTVCFVRDYDALGEVIELGRRIAGKTKFWICWQKGKKGGINDIPIRNDAVALGLVDYKVCSLDPTWSGMVFALKKA